MNATLDRVSRDAFTRFARIGLAIAGIVGAFLIAFPLAISLPSKTAAGDNLLSAVRPYMTDAAFAQARADEATVGTVGTQLNAVIAALATELHTTPAQLEASLATTSPRLAAGLGQLGAIQQRLAGIPRTLQAQQANFRQAEQIPTGFLPATTMTAFFVVPGAALLILAVVGFVRPQATRRLLLGAGAVGLVVSIGLASASLSVKTSAADRLNAALRPVFTIQTASQMEADITTVLAMTNELTTSTLPTIAASLGVTPVALDQSLATQFPSFTAGLAQMPQLLGRLSRSETVIAANIDNFAQSASIPWSPGSLTATFWLLMGPALLVAAVGAAALAGGVGSVALRRAPRLHAAMHRH